MTKRSSEAIASYIRSLPHKPIETLASHCGCTYTQQQARFVIWAPARADHDLYVELIFPDNTIEQHALTPIQNDFLIAIIDDVPIGCTYYYRDKTDGTKAPDIYSVYQPHGLDGPSAILDMAYEFSYEIKHRCPQSIIKVHIGTASPQGTFADFEKNTLKEKLFHYADAIEFLPIGEFPGAYNWGYDGGPNFLTSVSRNYGTPLALMHLLDTLHARNILVGFDIQLNHYGPEGVHQDWYGPYLSQEPLEWGYRPNFVNPIVRTILLQQLLRFVHLYKPDYLRLDMSSRYGDDTIITDIRTLTGLPIIIEDERHIPGLVNTVGNECIAQWHFPTVHALEKIRTKDYTELAKTVELLLYKSTTHVVYANSHDEQGNNQAIAPFDRITYGLTALTNGAMLFFYSFGFFHFFCDYQDDVRTVMVTAEKCGCLKGLDPGMWPMLKPLHGHFQEFKHCQEFFGFIHSMWQKEIGPLATTDPKRISHVKVWIKNNPQLIELCRAYNQAIFGLSNNAYSFSGKGFYNYICLLFKIRQNNPWLKTDYPHGTYTYSVDNQEISIARHSIETKARVTLHAQLPEHVTFNVTEGIHG